LPSPKGLTSVLSDRVTIVLGGALCLWDDMAHLAPDLFDTARVIAVNQAGYLYGGRIDAWVTLHPEELPGWREKRTAPGDYLTFSRRKPELMDHIVPQWGALASGGYGVAVARDYYRAGEVILCGVPMDPSPNFAGEAWWDYSTYRPAWVKALAKLDGVYSMSGWTRDLLGPPPAHYRSRDAES